MGSVHLHTYVCDTRTNLNVGLRRVCENRWIVCSTTADNTPPAHESPHLTSAAPAPAPAVTVARTQPRSAPRHCYTYNGGKITNDPFLFRYLHYICLQKQGETANRAQHWHSTYLTTLDHRKFLKIVSLFLFTTYYSHPTRHPPLPAPV